MPEQTPLPIEIQVQWPDDTYDDATPANLFVFTDNIDSICFAFGFLALPPRVGELAAQSEGRPLFYSVDRKTAFVLPKRVVLELHDKLGEFITNNPQVFGREVSTDAAAGVPSTDSN